MLYERWRSVAQERQNDLALHDLASGRQWTFGQLARLTEASDAAAPPVIFPQSQAPEFIFAVLRAWRGNAALCPLEPAQTPPSLPLLPPPGVHLKTTSASTGAPRMVAFTGPQLAADAANIVATMGLRPDWPNLGVISLAHSYGFSNLVLPLLLHGIPLVLAASPLPELVRQAGGQFPALTLAGVPALWRAWEQARAIPPSVRLAISAGAPLPLLLEQAVFAACGLKVHNFYGSTECGGIAYDQSSQPRQENACVGAPLQNVELSVNDDGCLCVHSRAVGESYWPLPAETLGGGRFQTGDLAELRGGMVYLRGRLDDQINVAGRKLSPAPIEEALRQHPGVGECLVFGAPGRAAERGDLIVACVTANEPVTEAALKQFLLGKLPAWQVPRVWWFVHSLETNQRGKISRAEWRQRFLQRGPEPWSD